jgi:hypothetical protein
MTVVVNLRNPNRKKCCWHFWDSLHYDYQNAPDSVMLTSEQEREIVRRDAALKERPQHVPGTR